jgi:FMN phosphatase YigB (HAD superfamily)
METGQAGEFSLKIHAIPSDLRGIIFDVDGTLYSNAEYLRDQIDVQIAHLAKLRGTSFEVLDAEIRERRRDLALGSGGVKTSLGNVLESMGIPIATSIEWRETLLEPERYLSPDPTLRAVLLELASRFSLAVVTNNPVKTGTRTLAALGVADLFPVIVGLDTTLVSKPAEEPFAKAAEGLGLPPGRLLAVGDRYDVDLAVPLSMGMGAILVDGVEDIYGFPALLSSG